MGLTHDVSFGPEPHGPLEEAIEAALQRFNEVCAERGIEVERLVVLADTPENHASTVAEGFESGGEIFAFLLAHLEAIAKAYGIDMKILKGRRFGGEG